MNVIAGRLPPRVAMLAAFKDAGILNAADLFVCDALLNAIAAPADLDAAIVLGLALAVRAPREGLVCVELADIAERLAGYVASGGLAWPQPADWIRALCACPALVSDAASAHSLPRRPLVLADGRLYLARAWEDELQLAARLTQWARQPAIASPVPLYTAGQALCNVGEFHAHMALARRTHSQRQAQHNCRIQVSRRCNCLEQGITYKQIRRIQDARIFKCSQHFNPRRQSARDYIHSCGLPASRSESEPIKPGGAHHTKTPAGLLASSRGVSGPSMPRTNK